MGTSDFSAEDLLTRRILQVPDYQRGYAWERSQLEDFWNDLTILPHGVDHYTGTLVLLPYGRDARVQDDGGTWHEPVDVVDGQQRLTTLVLFVNELRRRLATAGQHSHAEALATQFVSIWRGGQPQPRLYLGRDIHDFWRDCVLPDRPRIRPASLRSEQRLREAREFFREKFDERSTGHENSDIQDWLALRDVATDRLRFTLYEVAEPFRVGVIFETLNDRGKGLTHLEKTKNYLLFLTAALPDQQRAALGEQINNAWAHVYEELMAAHIMEPAEEDRFLRAHWLMSRHPGPRKWQGTDSVKQEFPREQYWQGEHDRLLAEVGAYVRELEESARAFCDIRQPGGDSAFAEFDNRREVRIISAKLLRVGGIASFTPLLMAVRLRFRDDGELYEQVVKSCERLAFRVYRLRGLRTNTGQQRLYSLAHETFHGQITGEEILNRLNAATVMWCPLTRMEREFAAEPNERNWAAWSGLRYFLYEYEEHLAGHRAVSRSWEDVASKHDRQTVEHVLPQHPREGEWTAFDERDRRRYTHDLGNLTLTFDNAAYSNRSFAEKRGPHRDHEGQPRPCYAHSPMLQEQELATYSDWTPESVRQRRRKLTDWARERWSIPGEDQFDTELGEPTDDTRFDDEDDAGL